MKKIVTFESLVRFAQTFFLNGLFFETKTMGASYNSPIFFLGGGHSLTARLRSVTLFIYFKSDL